MAKPKLDILLTNLATELGDLVSTPISNGDTYTAVQRLEAINRVRGTVYSDFIKAFNNDFDRFLKIYPEFVQIKNITFTSFIAVKPEDIRYIIKGRVGNYIFEPLKPKVVMEAVADSNSLFYADVNNPKFFEYKDKIVIYGVSDDPLTVSMTCVLQPTDVTYDSYSGVQATGVLTATGNPANNETITIGSKTYTIKTALSSPAVPNEILRESTASATLDNLIAAITGGAGEGTKYSTGTESHTLVNAAAGAGDTVDVTALTVGEVGNEIITTEDSSVLSWGSGTLTGGIDENAEDIIEPWAWLDLIVLAAKSYILRNMQD